MSENSRKAVERPAPTAFGRALKQLIREVWGSQSAFAAHLAVDESWIAKLVRTPDPRLSHASLARLVVGFPSASQREALYRAWIATCAPSPMDEDLASFGPGQAAVFASEVHDRISAGRVVQTRNALLDLWKRFGPGSGDIATAFALGEALVDCSNQLDRIGTSFQVCGALDEMCRPSEEPERSVRALWLRGVTSRLVRPRRIAQAEAAFDLAAECLGSARSGMPGYDGLAIALARDRLLGALDAFLAGGDGADFLASRLSRFEALCERAAGEDVALGIEVRARALVALNRLDEASDLLETATGLPATSANMVKRDVCRIQLLWQAGERIEAGDLFESSLDVADRLALVHHRTKLAALGRRMGVF